MTVQYEDELGWARIDDLLSSERALSITNTCLEMLDGPQDQLLPTDKANGGTLHLTNVAQRVPDASKIPELLNPVVSQILTSSYRLSEATFRCPRPGFGQQQLHADTLARLDQTPDDCVTAIVPLVPFTAENGATRLIPGSHRRPDLQRQAGKLDRHQDEIRLLGPAGCCFVFSGHVLHSGMKNESSQPRPALQITFRTGDPMGWPNP